MEVVTFFEIRDQPGVHRPPAQAFLSQGARCRIVGRCGEGKPTKVGVCLLAGNADDRQVQVATNDAGNVAEWNTLITDPVKSGAAGAPSTASLNRRAASRRWTAGQRLDPSPM